MNLFSNKSKYSLGLSKEPSDKPIDLKAIWDKVQSKKKQKCDNFDCSKDAIIRVADPSFEIKINLCQIHYDELAKVNNWDKEK